MPQIFPTFQIMSWYKIPYQYSHSGWNGLEVYLCQPQAQDQQQRLESVEYAHSQRLLE